MVTSSNAVTASLLPSIHNRPVPNFLSPHEANIDNGSGFEEDPVVGGLSSLTARKSKRNGLS